MFLEFVREEKVTSGEMAGATRRIYEFKALHNGAKCRKEVSVIGKTTSNAVYHFRTCALAGCEAHAAALMSSARLTSTTLEL